MNKPRVLILEKRKLRGRVCQCTVCGLVFGSLSGFDKHRTGRYPDRTCMSYEDLLMAGWNRDVSGKMTTGGFNWAGRRGLPKRAQK